MARLTVEQRFWKKVGPVTNTGCMEWLAYRNDDGYGIFSLERGLNIKAHRYAYWLKHGDFDENLLVCHTCDNTLCVNVAHLFLGSRKDNTGDMLRKGRSVSSLTVEQVIEIRRRYWEESELLRVLAEEFSVGISGIYSIVCNRTWKHLLSNQK